MVFPARKLFLLLAAGFFFDAPVVRSDGTSPPSAELPLGVKIQNGTPVLFESDVPVALNAFSASLGDSIAAPNPVTLREFKMAADTGISLVFPRGVTVARDNGKGFFLADKPTLDTGIRAILADNPHARIVLVIGGLHPPRSWYAYYQNTPFLMNEAGEHSAFPNPESPVYREAAANYIRDIVTYVDSRPYANAVIGYQVCAFEGGEFVLPSGYWGFSPDTRTAFQDWLRKQYGSVGSLQAAWNDRTIGSFEEAGVPSVADFSASDCGPFRDPTTRRKVVDFTRFWQKSDANFILALCEAVKKTSGKHPLVGAFYGYTLETAQTFSGGHLALRTLLDSPWIDFLAAPYSYVYRAPCWRSKPDADTGAGACHGPVDSILLNGKLFFSEDDTRTYLTKDNPKSHFPDEEGTVANLRRNHIANLCQGNGQWRLDLLGSGWYDSPGLMRELGLQKRVTDALLQDPAYAVPYTPDVALIVDEESSFHISTISGSNDAGKIKIDGFFRDHLQRAGINYGVYLMSDLLAGRVPDCRVYLFAGTYDISRAGRKWIDENLKRDGKTLVWFYGSGLYDETGFGVEKMASLTGFNFQEASNAIPSAIDPSGTIPSLTAPCATALRGQPEWYVDELPEGAKVLGNYVHDGTRLPAVVLAGFGQWTSVYFGSLSLEKDWALELMKQTGVHRHLETDATVPCYAGRGIVGIWPTEAMHGTVRLKTPSDVYDLYTGKLLFKNVNTFPVKLKQWEVAAFKTQPPGSKAWTP